jgi:hypothetical protein
MSIADARVTLILPAASPRIVEEGGELHETMDCLLDYRGRNGHLVPLVLTRNTGRDSSRTVRNVRAHVCTATDDWEKDEEDRFVQLKVLG